MDFHIFSNELETRVIAVYSNKIKNKIRFALISDLHSSVYGEGQCELLKAVRENSADAVLYAGDIFDSRQDDEKAKELLSGLSDYPCWFVTGNHEMKNTDGERNRQTVRSYGISVLQGTEETAVINGQRVAICGVDDSYDSDEEFERQIENIKSPVTGDYRIFLLHNPEVMSVYDTVKTDLMVCGHLHGGQWRLPCFNRGLVSARRTLFPKYSSGYYNVKGIDLVVSRGLSKTSTKIPRIFNRPEIIFIDVCPLHENVQKSK